MSHSTEILKRRKQFVPDAIGIFNPSTAASASGSLIIDADGKEMIDFAGGIGVVNAGHCPPPGGEAIPRKAPPLTPSRFNWPPLTPDSHRREKRAPHFLTGH